MTDSTDWYAHTHRATKRLVAIPSVSPSSDENDVAREVLRLLHEDGGAERLTGSGLEPVPHDPRGRLVAWAFLQGESSRTVVLSGHIDTVGTADYGALEPWALQPDALMERIGRLQQIAPGLQEDMQVAPDDWMVGRGVFDMKSGVAATITVMRHLAELERAPLSIVLVATPDEENESAGMLAAVGLLTRLRDEYGLEYVGAINTDSTTSRYLGDPDRTIYEGTIGKLLPGIFVAGVPAHAGDPLAGVDAALFVAEIVHDLDLNSDLCDTVETEHGILRTPPPVVLLARDLKHHYDTQIPFAAWILLNVLTYRTGPEHLLERMRTICEVALERALRQVQAAQRRHNTHATDSKPPDWQVTVLEYDELRTDVVALLGTEVVEQELRSVWDQIPADRDKRERCVSLVQRLWALSGRQGPAVVLFLAPPVYPPIGPASGDLHQAVAATVAAHPELRLRLEPYYPYLSDMSYLGLESGVDHAGLERTMPVWRDAPGAPGGYSLPLQEIRSLNIPVVNIGPYGHAVHQAGERVLMSYSFRDVPQLIVEVIDRLGQLGPVR